MQKTVNFQYFVGKIVKLQKYNKSKLTGIVLAVSDQYIILSSTYSTYMILKDEIKTVTRIDP